MSNTPFIPESAPFTSEQRAWLNGFLAGLLAQGTLPQPAEPAATAAPAEPLLVLFGSQTGTAEGLGRRLATLARQRGFAPQVFPLDEFQQANLVSANKVIIISRTRGDGDPPDNAAIFWSWLKAESAPRMDQLHYAVLGLGDRNYPDFCGASRKIDARLAELGAKRLLGREECDVDYEQTANAWIESLWAGLSAKVPSIAPGLAGSVTREKKSTPDSLPPTDSTHSANGSSSSSYGKHNPFPARLLHNVLLNKSGSAKEVRHYALDLRGSGLAYQAGDAIGIVPVNCPELVSDIILAVNASAESPVTVADSTLTLREALSLHLEISKPSQELIAAIASASPGTELARLRATGNAAELKAWLHGRGVIDLLRLLPRPFSSDELLPLLKKLAPRLYSISSSPKAHPGEVHLTVSSVRYQTHGVDRKGVASTFLADRVGDADFVKLFVQPSHFKPPAAGDIPMIMVGPGTGIAPFRAFLQERHATGASGKNWLFFGDQTRQGDFLYEAELNSWQKAGLLTRLDLAFSRDQAEKLYVQHRMFEQAAQIWAWLNEGACFYVCGDASRMAKDVDEALHKIIQTSGGKSHAEAQNFVSELRAQKRYQRDVY